MSPSPFRVLPARSQPFREPSRAPIPDYSAGMIEVPEAFARKKIAGEGAAGRDWIDALPAIVADLLRRWRCTPDGPVMYGEVGLVVPVRAAGLPPSVIKVSFPHPGNVHEPLAFVAWAGRGAVHLYERDDDRFAMLLERAPRGTLAAVTDIEAAVAVQGRLSRRLAVPAPPGLRSLAEHVAGWPAEIRETSAAFGDPLPAPVIEAAMATLEETARDRRALVLHGDLHDANILGADREEWLVVDPKGLAGDPAYDALNVVRSPRFGPVLVRADPAPGVRRLLAVYCAEAGIEFERAIRWVQAGAVHEAMWGRTHGDPEWLVELTDRLATALT